MKAMVSGLFFTVTLTAISADAADVRQGEKRAAQWCRSCHLTAPDQAGSLGCSTTLHRNRQDAGEREDDLRAWLVDPHPPMPNFDLTVREIDDLLAYIESLAGQ